MATINVITEGNKIDFRDILKKEQIEDGIKPNTYASQVLDFTKKGNMKVSMPFVQGRLVPLSKGQQYEAYFYTGKGIYLANVEILDRYKVGNMYTMEIELKTELKKYQRRQYYRLEKEINIQFTEMSLTEIKILEQTKAMPENVVDPVRNHDAVTVDISGGGMRFIGRNFKVDREKMIAVNFTISIDGETKLFSIPARVIVSFELPEHANRFEHRIEFTTITNIQRETLIRYIFEEERKLRNRTR